MSLHGKYISKGKYSCRESLTVNLAKKVCFCFQVNLFFFFPNVNSQ